MKFLHIWLGEVFGREVPGRFPLLLKAGLSFAFSAFVLYVDPLEISSRSERHARDLFNALLGPPAALSRADSVAVVTLNDTTLRALGVSWPLSYALHADIVDAILAQKPKALVVDVLFVDPLRRDNSLGDLSDTLRQSKDVPVFLAAAPRRLGNETAILAPLDPANWGSDRARGELVAVDNVPENGAHSPYTLVSDTAPDSPAFAVYRRLSNGAGRIKDADYRWPMEISWPVGNGMGADAQRLIGARCRDIPETLPARLAAILGDRGALSGIKQDCPPYPAILAQYLLRPFGREEALSRTLHGKVVFYGVSIVGNADTIRVGHVDAPLPGVFAHAAAFENLLRFEDRYLAAESRAAWLNESAIEAVLSLIGAFVIFIGTRRAQVALAKREDGGFLRNRIAVVWPIWLVSLVCVYALVFVTIYVEVALLAMAPSNWIALLLLPVSTIAMMEPAIETAERKTTEKT